MLSAFAEMKNKLMPTLEDIKKIESMLQKCESIGFEEFDKLVKNNMNRAMCKLFFRIGMLKSCKEYNHLYQKAYDLYLSKKEEAKRDKHDFAKMNEIQKKYKNDIASGKIGELDELKVIKEFADKNKNKYIVVGVPYYDRDMDKTRFAGGDMISQQETPKTYAKFCKLERYSKSNDFI